MGECIGLDFGTTYTVVAHTDGGEIEAVDYGGEESSITAMESVLVSYEDEDYIGYHTRNLIGEPGAQVYKGFKMLLNHERNGNIDLKKQLASHGYSDRTPEDVTASFMKLLFDEVGKVAPRCKKIDKVVVGVPHVWTCNGDDTRKYEVVDIVQESTGAQIIDFWSEPKLACAYFVNEINKHRDDNYNGYIFVIDYGGGTLDLTLCYVENKSDKPSISVVGPGWGKGENTDGEIGNAGLAFMEKLADLILEENNVDFTKDAKYQKFVKDIEIQVKSQSVELKRKLDKYEVYFSLDGAKFDSEIPGISAYYGNAKYSAKYSSVSRAYNESIRGVLASVLEEAKEYMDLNGIPYNDCVNNTFKIATIGGFCKFALTEKQIRNDTEWLMRQHETCDSRYTELDDYVPVKMRELAIAYGAALVANDIIEIKTQCPYSFFCYPEKRGGGYDKEQEFAFFIENEIFEPGKPMLLGYINDNGDLVRGISFGGTEIPYICREQGGNKSQVKQPRDTMNLPSGQNIYIAIAIERDEKLTLYVYEKDKYDNLSAEEKEKPRNEALIGQPERFPNIDRLLGSLYR